MSREALEKWADALEFDDRVQITGDLRDWFPDGKWGFCGLGVACDVYAETHGLSKTSIEYEDLFDPEDGNIPVEVEKWLGIPRPLQAAIIELNDSGRATLPQIGSWVRDNLLKEE